MRPQDIKNGETYRLKHSPYYSYFKAIQVIPAGIGINTKCYAIVKGEHTVNKDDKFGFIKYYRASDLIKELYKPRNL